MKLDFKYDRAADVLYAFKGEPRPYYAEESEDGILVLHDIKTNKLIGFMIINYSRQKAAGYLREIPGFPHVEIPY